MNYISKIIELITALRTETRQDAITPESLGSILLRMVRAQQTSWGASQHPFYHIECDTKNGRLIVKHPTDMIEKGYVPYLLRYSKKKPRYRRLSNVNTRTYGPVMRGWHLFYDEKKLQMAPDGVVSIGKNVGTDREPEWVYEENCRNLFGNIRTVTFEDSFNHTSLIGFKVGFGCRTYRIKNNHRFRFGIVFGPPMVEKGNRSLKFSECVSNIAEFYVNFHKRNAREVGNEAYKISYSI